MTVATYLSQEGFNEERKGVFFSREINTLITSTASKELWDITVNEFTYRDIMSVDLDKAIDAIHTFNGTARVVKLYNLQRAVLLKHIYPIKEDI